MDYKTIMVHPELGHSNAGLLEVAASLAERSQAHAIGIAACQPMRPIYDDGSAAFSGEVVADDYRQMKKEIKDAEEAFRTVFSGRAQSVRWRSAITFLSLAGYVACQARAADLIVTSVNADGSIFDDSRSMHVGDLIMQAGRPVLIVPRDVKELKLKNVLVGWKGTRETRRAVMDALPLLKMAKQVSVVEVSADDPRALGHVKDVAEWLGRHGIEADALVLPARGADASRLGAYAREEGVDLLVAGAYGHNRLREWVFGGVTSDLLLKPDCCVLLSH